jgi:hypothetical protein
LPVLHLPKCVLILSDDLVLLMNQRHESLLLLGQD